MRMESRSPPITIDNGLCIRFAQLKHEIPENRIGRGKLYDLIHLEPQKRLAIHEHLRRHAEVCDRLKLKPRIAQNFEVRPLGKQSGWWVVDHWIEGRPLNEMSEPNSAVWPLSRIAWLGGEILRALGELHSVDVIVRELTPDRIYVEPSRITLTDFELARLVNGGISVQGAWKSENPYRAPEVSDRNPRLQSDLYSWARVMCFVLTGHLIPKTIPSLLPYPKIEQLLKRFLHSSFGRRPKTTDEVLVEWMSMMSRIEFLILVILPHSKSSL